jgi:hypothetical protein
VRRIAVLGIATALAIPALAGAAAVVHVTPASVKPGHMVRMHGPIVCQAGDQVELVSWAFKGSGHSVGGVPAVITEAGPQQTYSVRFRIRKSVHRAKYGITLLCHRGFFGGGSLTVL